MTTVLLAGATGLVGGRLLEMLKADSRVSRIVILSRRESGLAGGKVEEVRVDFEALAGVALPAAEAAFCTLGTTLRKAGSQSAFAKVDRDYVVAFAGAARGAGARSFALVSALGADPHSTVFYNRIKGEAEEGVKALGFPAVHIVRPSLLVGDRTEFRPMERLGVVLAPILTTVLRGALKRYAPVEADTVAKALLAAGIPKDPQIKPGCFVHESETLGALAHQA